MPVLVQPQLSSQYTNVIVAVANGVVVVVVVVVVFVLLETTMPKMGLVLAPPLTCSKAS